MRFLAKIFLLRCRRAGGVVVKGRVGLEVVRVGAVIWELTCNAMLIFSIMYFINCFPSK